MEVGIHHITACEGIVSRQYRHDGAAFYGWQQVSPLLVGHDDGVAIRDEHAPQSFLSTVTYPVLVAVVKDNACDIFDVNGNVNANFILFFSKRGM